MFYYKRNRSLIGGAFTTAELVFHAVVRNVRSQHSNAVLSVLINIFQVLVLVSVFYVIMSLLGARVAKIRGEFILYLLSGVFLFLTHIKAVGSVSGLDTGNNPMMLHSPMNMMVVLMAAAFGSLYTQVLTIVIILFVYSVSVAPLEIQEPGGAFAMLMLAWFTGCAVGVVFMAIKPWFPTTATIMSTIYRRLNMVFSGKMFVGNALGGFMLTMFAWNPLFHIIDQCRGFVFRNYYPRNTNWEYPVWVGLALLLIGLLGIFFTRQHVSQSWSARR
ncbi:ABC transporter permease [Ruegeria faecimaris]|uniref:ABC-type polysaccharide/polyol phosphate export permease n=1 Tax=Ruegeria faecimaris TaxID=686389 RepID=A0A521DIJ0_9RHOB|nr:ABC transporter permease [Ruegeria faecimaris]SMO70740.1 ABC-type polysaccharide/polyol phosphate export permease [Ruegeria faecimaris]